MLHGGGELLNVDQDRRVWCVQAIPSTARQLAMRAHKGPLAAGFGATSSSCAIKAVSTSSQSPTSGTCALTTLSVEASAPSHITLRYGDRTACRIPEPSGAGAGRCRGYASHESAYLARRWRMMAPMQPRPASNMA
jgi:hypothetical protein